MLKIPQKCPHIFPGNQHIQNKTLVQKTFEFPKIGHIYKQPYNLLKYHKKVLLIKITN